MLGGLQTRAGMHPVTPIFALAINFTCLSLIFTIQRRNLIQSSYFGLHFDNLSLLILVIKIVSFPTVFDVINNCNDNYTLRGWLINDRFFIGLLIIYNESSLLWSIQNVSITNWTRRKIFVKQTNATALLIVAFCCSNKFYK